MTWRVYYNREKDWPQCWSIDEGTQASEINVIGVRFARVQACTVVGDRSVDPQTTPAAWLEIHAQELRIENGIAIFF